ncbi:MAG: YegP family protein [Halioglobus sp.]
MAGKYELKKTASGKFMFNLKAGNSQIILTSELYESKSAAENGIASVQKNSPDDARYERKESKNGDPFFVLKATNGQAIGKSEMYSSASAMENGVESVKKNGPTTDVADIC